MLKYIKDNFINANIMIAPLCKLW